MSTITAVYVNINSIQEYIYHSNRLKENIGASQITDTEVFFVTMKSVLESLFSTAYYIPIYTEVEMKDVQIQNADSMLKCEVADIGGGASLLLFKDAKDATDFIRVFSKTLLLKFPGLKMSFAKLDNFNCQNQGFRTDFEKIKNELTKNKHEHHLTTSVFKYGITADCTLNNESAEMLFEDKGAVIPKSKVATSKFNCAEKAGEHYQSLLSQKYPEFTLTTEIEKLGQNKEAGYIAIVHIDGNGMGAKLNVSSIKELRGKTKQIKNAAKGAMNKLLIEICKTIDAEDGKTFLGVELDSTSDQKYILPIRPIMVGGDDVTFVCEGRIGMYLAERFLQIFTDKSDEIMDGACAGVAIVKTKFPFYKAYTLAEELCREAKSKSRSTPGSYLSYYYSSTTFSGSLEQLRTRTHQCKNGSLYFGPYKLECLDALKDGVALLNTKVPKNKVMQLRDVLIESTDAQTLFGKELREANIQLQEPLWTSKRTPYFDQIELMDFYLYPQNSEV